MSFEIESGIDLPSRNNRSKYPWPDMGFGDSFFVPDADAKQRSTIQSSGRSWCKKNNPEATVVGRLVDGGARFWMVVAEPDGDE